MLHEQASKQQQTQPKNYNFCKLSNNVEQHVDVEKVAPTQTTIQQKQLSNNSSVATFKTNKAAYSKNVANTYAAATQETAAAMLLVVKAASEKLQKKSTTNFVVAQIANAEQNALQHAHVASNMLMQHQANTANSCQNDANLEQKHKICTTAVTKMLPALSNSKRCNTDQQYEPDPDMTIDFNRRRRRGRLRFALTAGDSVVTAPTATTTTQTALPSTKPPAITSSLPNITATPTPTLTPSYLCTFFSLLLLSQLKSIASKMLLLLTTLAQLFISLYQQLKCYLLNYVNTVTILVLSSSAAADRSSTLAATLAKLAATSASAAPATKSFSSPSSTSPLAAATTAFAATVAIANNKCIHHRHRHVLAAAAAASQRHGSGSGICCKQLIYVFLIFTNILPRNSSNLFADAAKPKSATQTHQHQQQQQQLAQQTNTQLQPFNPGNNGVLTPPSYQVVSSQTSMEEDDTELMYPSSQSEEQLFDEANMEDDENAAYEVAATNATHHANVTEAKTPLFPTDLFTKQQLEDGWVFCHILGVIYMFVALAIVCDEFFVPSLDVIIEKLDITDDVAGATFMAAGGSAPELFTSVIGVFVSFDDVGIGTIVGSAVFNILFVIGMCALFSKTVLTLTWWPLFRDCTFYSISLIVLIIFFRDNKIYWYEALTLFTIYICYVAFMKWNVQVERFVKKLITRNQVTRVRSTDQLMPAGNAANSSETSMATQPGGSVTSRAASETRSGPAGGSHSGATGNSSGGTAGSTQTGAKFRHGLLQLMIHTIDPLHDDDVPGKVDEKATQLHAIASLKVLLDATKPQRGGATTSAANHVKINLKETTLADRPNGNIDTTLDSPSLSGRRPSWIEQRVKIQTRKFSIKQTNDLEDEPEPLSMAWPDTARKRLTYILVAPLLIPMWLTLPDTRSPRGRKYFAITFIGSIVWIAAFSYLMVWWANVAGETAKIPPEVMGLTFLAAGTSIPDLITSVIVARKGYGDMAVSSSVGSNIFDVTVGLPIPWLLYGIIYGAPVEVNSVGMVCSITILFMMLIFVVMSIACFRWRMNKGLGFTMFLLYFVFVAVSLMFEYDVIRCPV